MATKKKKPDELADEIYQNSTVNMRIDRALFDALGSAVAFMGISKAKAVEGLVARHLMEVEADENAALIALRDAMRARDELVGEVEGEG